MPINDPIRNRKVAPRSLAFERESTNSSVTYQAAGGAGASVTVNNTYITSTAASEAGLMDAVMDAERRAKHWVGAYHKQFLWSLAPGTYGLYIGGSTFLPANTESIRIMGAQYEAGAGPGGEDMWRWQCVPGAEGVYHVYAHYKVAFTELMAISRVRLGFFRNGTTLIAYVDDLWVSDAGELPILNANVKGGLLVQMNTGDYLTVGLVTTSGAGSALQSFTAESSLEGYVMGHRVQCNDDWYIAAPDPQDSYIVAT